MLIWGPVETCVAGWSPSAHAAERTALKRKEIAIIVSLNI